MAPDSNIVTLTLNPSLDISADTTDVGPTKKMRCENVRRDPGGGGINVSRAVTILGGTSTAIFPSGGHSGRSIAEMLRRQGIDSQPVLIDQLIRENFSVRDKKSEEQYRFVLPGPTLSEQEWRQCLDKVRELQTPPAYFIASGSLPPGVPDDFYGRLAKHFQGSSTRVIFDTSGKPLKDALEHEVYLIKPNLRELESICGCSLAKEKDQETICRKLVDQGVCEVLVLTLGADGALLTTRDTQLRAGGLKVEQVSSVGAGDSFVGAMVLALHQGRDVIDAFLYGMAAGTAALLTGGTELCRPDDTERLFQTLKENSGRA